MKEMMMVPGTVLFHGATIPLIQPNPFFRALVFLGVSLSSLLQPPSLFCPQRPRQPKRAPTYDEFASIWRASPWGGTKAELQKQNSRR